MTYKQEIEWKKFSNEKPTHNEWCVFFSKTISQEEGKEEKKEDITFFFGQFRHMFTEKPDVYKEDYIFFAVPQNQVIVPDESAQWTSLEKLADSARDNFKEKNTMEICKKAKKKNPE